MTRTEIEEKVRKMLIEDMEIDEDKITADATLKDDIGIDSLDFVDIVVLVKRDFGFRMEKGDLRDVSTFSQFCNYIESRLG